VLRLTMKLPYTTWDKHEPEHLPDASPGSVDDTGIDYADDFDTWTPLQKEMLKRLVQATYPAAQN
jgi:hypothetical protein